MKTILFVCTANLHRSPLCKGIFQRLLVERNLTNAYQTDSAGITGYYSGSPAGVYVYHYFQEHGIDFKHHSKPIRDVNLTPDHILVAVDQIGYDDLVETSDLHGIPLFKLGQFEYTIQPSALPILCSDIADPSRSAKESLHLYRLLGSEIKPMLINLLDYLITLETPD